MTNTAELLAYIEKSGLKKNYIAKTIGITPHTLAKKINNLCEFKVSEMRNLCALLEITPADRDRIFFNK